MHFAPRVYAPEGNFPQYDTLGDTTMSGDPSLADAWVAFDFGDGGIGADGELRPGFANYSIASYVKKHATQARFDTRLGRAVFEPKVQIHAQTLVAQELIRLCPGIEESPLFNVVGTPTEENQYVDSWMVANEARALTPWARPGDSILTPGQAARRRQGLPAGRVAIAGVEQHADRLVRQGQRAFWTSAEVYKPAGLPETYADPNSTQPWTTRAFAIPFDKNPKTMIKKFFTESWWPREMVTRALCWANGGQPSVDNILAVPGLLIDKLKRRQK